MALLGPEQLVSSLCSGCYKRLWSGLGGLAGAACFRVPSFFEFYGLLFVSKERGCYRGWVFLEGGGYLSVRERKKLRFFRVSLSLFSVASHISKSPPPFFMCWRPVFIGKMLLGFSAWSLNFFLFCKFWFFLFFCIFLKTSNINVDSMRKINDFKNNAWKVERVRKSFFLKI